MLKIINIPNTNIGRKENIMAKRWPRSHSREFTMEDTLKIFEFFRNFGVAIASEAESVISVEDYLQRGDKILSLAKEHYAKKLKELEVSTFEELLFSVEPSKGDTLIEALAKRVIRPILRDTPIVQKDNEQVLDISYEPYAQMMAYIDMNVNVSVTQGPRFIRHRFYRQLEAGDCILNVEFNEPNLWLDIFGVKNHTHSNNNRNVLFLSGECVADVALFLSYMVVCSIFKRVFTDIDGSAYQLFLQEYEKSCKSSGQYRAAAKFLPYLNEKRVTNLYSGNGKTTFDSDPFKRCWVCPKQYEPSLKELNSLIERFSIKIEVVDASYEDLYNCIKEDILTGRYPDLDEIPVLVSDDFVEKLFSYDTPTFMTTVPNLFRYSFCLSNGRKSNNSFALPSLYNTTMEIISCAFKSAYENTHEVVKTARALRQSASDYAKSYMTKKNINKSTLKAMEESVLNSYFGYVEFDNEVDLKKVEIISKEFEAFKETYLSGIDSKNNAIRFRKLGNYKALGLYFPSVHCLCVDVGSPGSLLHEYAHLIDYCYGNLSLKGTFSQVKYKYRTKLFDNAYKNKAFLEQLNSNKKYNKDYYLNPTEIFARCFEIYISKVLKVENSLTPDVDNKPEYPVDEEFISLITEYFKSILPVLNGQNTKEDISL